MANMIPEDPGPGVVEHLPTLRPKMLKGVEYVGGFVVFYVKHSLPLIA